MKLSFQLIFLVATTVVGTVLVAAEPCNPNDANGCYGEYDMTGCNFCAEHGKGHGQCCDAIYRHSLRWDDDDLPFTNPSPWNGDCIDLGVGCTVGESECFPGLTCNAAKTCKLQTDNQEAHAATASLVMSSSSTGNTTKGGPFFVLVVVSLLGAAMITMKVVLQRRRRVLLHRHQYNEVDASRIDV